jgi:hypothetical protein
MSEANAPFASDKCMFNFASPTYIMSGSLPIIHEEPHPPVAPGPQAVRVGEGFFYYGCLTGHDIKRRWQHVVGELPREL